LIRTINSLCFKARFSINLVHLSVGDFVAIVPSGSAASLVNGRCVRGRPLLPWGSGEGLLGSNCALSWPMSTNLTVSGAVTTSKWVVSASPLPAQNLGLRIWTHSQTRGRNQTCGSTPQAAESEVLSESVIQVWFQEDVTRTLRYGSGSPQSCTVRLWFYFPRALCCSSAIRTSWLRVLTPVFWKSC
jgi:hypothetical protein